MKKHLLIIACLLSTVMAFAQTPQYFFTSWNGGVSAQGFSQPGAQKIQSLYYPTDFPGVKTRALTAIYLRVGRLYGVPAPKIVTIDTFHVKMGYTTDSFFHRRSISPAGDTFATGLTLVVNMAHATFSGVDTLGKWIRVPMDGNFLYDSSRRFIVEVSRSYHSQGSFDLMASNIRLKKNGCRSMGLNNGRYVYRSCS